MMIDLEIMKRDIRLSRGSFDGSNPLDIPVRLWIDEADKLVKALEESLKEREKLADELDHWHKRGLFAEQQWKLYETEVARLAAWQTEAGNLIGKHTNANWDAMDYKFALWIFCLGVFLMALGALLIVHPWRP